MKKDVERLNKFKQQCDDLFKYEIIEGVDVRSDKYEIFYNTWKEKVDESATYDTFDWRYYLSRYKDLRDSGINNKENAWIHYINNGKKELRSCNPTNDIVNIGQLGCLLSHINVLKDAIDKKYENILILEDDIIISDSFNKRIHEIKELMDKDWNIIYLGVSQRNWDNIHIYNNFYTAKETTGTFAYIINSSFYETLLNKFKNINKPVDNYLVEIQETYMMKVVYPNIIFCELEDSNISEKRKHEIWYKKFKWDL